MKPISNRFTKYQIRTYMKSLRKLYKALRRRRKSFPGGSVSKNPPPMQETWVQSLDWEDPLEEGMATHSRILAWRILMDRGAWQAIVRGVTEESDTTEWLSTAQHKKQLVAQKWWYSNIEKIQLDTLLEVTVIPLTHPLSLSLPHFGIKGFEVLLFGNILLNDALLHSIVFWKDLPRFTYKTILPPNYITGNVSTGAPWYSRGTGSRTPFPPRPRIPKSRMLKSLK